MTHNFLLADACGLGKTLMAIESASRYVVGPVLILTRKASKAFWRQSFIDQGYAPQNIHVSVEAGLGLPLPILPGEGQRESVYITHHEALLSVGGALAKEKWSLIVVDEAHRFRHGTDRTKVLNHIHAPLQFALTATPYGKDPSDMWAILHWLYPKAFHSFWKFYERYVDYFQPQGAMYRIVRGGKNLDDLGAVLAPFYMARSKMSVLPDLPEQLPPAEVPVSLRPQQAKAYATILKDSYLLYQRHELVMENALVEMLRLHQVSLDPGLCIPGWKEEPGKVRWLVEWLEDNPNQPVVLAVRYRKFIERYLSALKWPTIVGGMTSHDTELALDRFNETGRLVGTIAAISEGLNLQRANVIIIPDGTPSPTEMYQLAQRVHRIGQTLPCQTYHLLGWREEEERWTVDRLLLRKAQRRLSEQGVLNGFIEEATAG